MAHQRGEAGEHGREDGSEPNVRLAIGNEVEHDAGAGEDRHPEEEAALLGFGLDGIAQSAGHGRPRWDEATRRGDATFEGGAGGSGHWWKSRA